MKPRHLMTAALGALVLSCQGPAAVLAQEAAASGDRHPQEAVAAAERTLKAGVGLAGV